MWGWFPCSTAACGVSAVAQRRSPGERARRRGGDAHTPLALDVTAAAPRLVINDLADLVRPPWLRQSRQQWSYSFVLRYAQPRAGPRNQRAGWISRICDTTSESIPSSW